MNRSQHHTFDAAIGLAPQTITSTTTGSAVDLKGYDAATALVHAGTFTGGSGLSVGLVESDNDSDYTTVAAEDLVYSTLAMTVAGTLRVGYRGTKRYVKVVLTLTSGVSVPVSAVVLRQLPERMPV